MPQRVELPNRLPLYSPLSTRSGDVPLDRDCRLINGYVEYDPSDKQYWIYKRPGLALNNILQWTQGAGLGVYQSSSIAGLFNVFTVTGSALRQGTTIIDSNIDARPNLPYLFETIVANPTISTPLTIIMVSPFAQYLITVAATGSTVASIAAAIPAPRPVNLPNLVPGVVYLDGTVYVMDPQGNIWGSNINDATTWNPLNVIAADATSDQGVALAKQLNYVIAFKQTTAQVFFDNQNPAPGSPLSPVPDSQIPLGCFAPYSVKTIDNSLFWVSANETVSPQVVQLDNLIPKIVSTPSVERLLQNALVDSEFGGDGITAWVFKRGGHRFYGMLIFNLNLCLVYDMDQKAWFIWTDFAGNAWPIVGTSYQGALSIGIAGPQVVQTTNGIIYNIDTANKLPNDNGVLFPVDIYTPNFDAGVDKSKMLNLLRFNSDQTQGSVLNVRYNDNDYDPRSWSNFRNVDLSQERPYIDNEGSFYRRAYHLRHRCNTALRIKSGDLLMGIGTL